MDREKILEKLQDSARELSAHEDWFKSAGQSKLSEYACVQRLINFKVQKIVSENSKEELENSFEELYIFLFNQMEYYRDNRIDALAELYGTAIDGLRKAQNIVCDYLL